MGQDPERPSFKFNSSTLTRARIRSAAPPLAAAPLPLPPRSLSTLLHATAAAGIVDGVVSGLVLGVAWRGAVVLADKTGLKEQIEKARDKLRK